MSTFGPEDNIFEEDAPQGQATLQQKYGFGGRQVPGFNKLQKNLAFQDPNLQNLDFHNYEGVSPISKELYRHLTQHVDNSSITNSNLSKGRTAMASYINERYKILEDDKGNPKYLSLVDDTKKQGNKILAEISAGIPEGVDKEQFIASFKNELINYELDASREARAQQRNYALASFDNQHNSYIAASKANKTVPSGQYLNAFSQQLAAGVEQGILTEEEAIDREGALRQELKQDRLNNINQRFNEVTSSIVKPRSPFGIEAFWQSLNPGQDHRLRYINAGLRLEGKDPVELSQIGDNTVSQKSGAVSLSDMMPGGLPMPGAEGKGPKISQEKAMRKRSKPKGRKEIEEENLQVLRDSVQAAEEELNNMQQEGLITPEEVKVEKSKLDNRYKSLIKSAAAQRAKEATELNKVVKAAQAEMDKQIQGTLDLVKKGKQVPEDNFFMLEEAIKDTPLEKKYQAKINQAKALSVFTGLSQDARQKYLNSNLPPAIKNELLSINDSIEKESREDPIGSLQSRGMVDLTPLDVEKDLVSQLQVRGTVADYAKLHDGRTSHGLTSEEVESLGNFLGSLDVAEKTQVLKQINEGLGKERANQLYASLGDPSLALAGHLSSQGSKGQKQANIALIGANALKNKEIKSLPKFKEQLSAELFVGIPEGPEGDGMREQLLQRASLMYAGLSKKELDFSNELNPDRMQKAMHLALGGQPITLGGKDSLVLSPSVNDDRDSVNKELKNLDIMSVGKLGGIKNIESIIDLPPTVTGSETFQKEISRAFMEDFTYESAGNGKYLVMDNGTPLRRADNNQPFILDIAQLRGETRPPIKAKESMEEVKTGLEMAQQLGVERDKRFSDQVMNILESENMKVKTSAGLKDVSHMAADELDVAFGLEELTGVDAKDLITYYDSLSIEVGEESPLTQDEWSRLVADHGTKYNIGIGDMADPRAQMAMLGELYKEIKGGLERRGVDNPTVRDIKIAHVLGNTAASKLINASLKNPDLEASDIFSAEEIAKHPELLAGDVVDIYYRVSDLALEGEEETQEPFDGSNLEEGEVFQ